ncbi:4-hydroxyphenylacetate 3-monooxygenase, oxygenase component [Paenisporosarcina quisquiliarum]|uniref:4-hydroxyphenylacetate 3-monooxygenase, oxygenase component n=1 Tax=Paenisporosarcina quisquiliarum TaxID=365346 RepID=A0A9X3LDP1_9BACL|nr:4-hydroxyphenylacetate 3-monooxygenase, oxygenase component [Paenisporosarcina quisquiliarum]MCZ8535917.1 4-hydroxyphenylacetate 3-monooxygenase, oxygenase component [Paenisporosarcina quisquiliarum]
MGAVNGKALIDRLDQLKSEIWFDGEMITGKLSEHPAFKGILKTKASLYDLQLDPSLANELTFISPDTNKPTGLSYLKPKTKEDIVKRRKMMEHWARQTKGMMGRSPDYINSVIMAFASSASFLKGKEKCFPENIQSVYESAMSKDLTFTHTFVTPQVNRSLFNYNTSKEPIAAKVIDHNEQGLVIKGARLLATQGGLTDEVLVFSTPNFFLEEDEAYAFSIPSDTPGLKFICRESFVGGDSTFNHPLSSRFEEMDSLVVFDDVLVPWNRVFYYGNIEASVNFLLKSSFHCFALHQTITRQIVKSEFMLGIAQLLVETIDVGEYQHIHEKISEFIIGLETMKALLEKSEQNSELDEFGTMRPHLPPLQIASNIFPNIYPRFCEIIQIIGASGMVTLPTEKAINSSIGSNINHYLQGSDRTAEERIKIFRLAWDLTMSSFGTRQIQYERYFFGDPIRMSSTLYNTYPKAQYVKNVCEFLDINSEGTC